MKNQKGFVPVLVLISLVIVLILIIGSYFLFQLSQNNLGQKNCFQLNEEQCKSRSDCFPDRLPNPASNFWCQDKPATVSPSITAQPTKAVDETVTWKTYKNTEAGFNFKYPDYLDTLIQKKDFYVSVEIKNGLNNPYKGKDCPGICGIFADNSNLYQKQFALLTQIANIKDCKLDQNYIKEFKKDFILFYAGPPGKLDVQGIKLSNQQCGVKYIATDGYAVGLDILFYRITYIVDNKAVGISFPLLPLHVFSQVDKLYSDLGYDLSGDSYFCDSSCSEQGAKYFDKLTAEGGINNDEITKSVIQIYDQILSTFKFN